MGIAVTGTYTAALSYIVNDGSAYGLTVVTAVLYWWRTV